MLIQITKFISLFGNNNINNNNTNNNNFQQCPIYFSLFWYLYVDFCTFVHPRWFTTNLVTNVSKRKYAFSCFQNVFHKIYCHNWHWMTCKVTVQFNRRVFVQKNGIKIQMSNDKKFQYACFVWKTKYVDICFFSWISLFFWKHCNCI